MKVSRVVEVAIGSPNDVSSERDTIESCIRAWNAHHSDHYGVILQPVSWKIDVTPGQGDPERRIQDRLGAADMLIAVFWTRLGTPTQKAQSGTVEEIKHFADLGKPVVTYFSDCQIAPGLIDTEQYDQLLAYRRERMGQELYWTFDSVASL